MMKREAREILGLDEDPDVVATSEATWDITEFLLDLHDRGELRTDFVPVEEDDRLPRALSAEGPQHREAGPGSLRPHPRPDDGRDGRRLLRDRRHVRAEGREAPDLPRRGRRPLRAGASRGPDARGVRLRRPAAGTSSRRPASRTCTRWTSCTAPTGFVRATRWSPSSSSRTALPWQRASSSSRGQMGGDQAHMEPAGGMEDGIGTDFELIGAAIERAREASEGDGVLVLMDLGSAVQTAQMVLELGGLDEGAVRLVAAPLVEGAVAASISAGGGASLEEVAREAAGALRSKQSELGDDGEPVAERQSPLGNLSQSDSFPAAAPSPDAESSSCRCATGSACMRGRRRSSWELAFPTTTPSCCCPTPPPARARQARAASPTSPCSACAAGTSCGFRRAGRVRLGGRGGPRARRHRLRGWGG